MKKILMLCAAMAAMAFGASGQSEVSYDWIDLGLPSGVLWANQNVGANKPEEFGDHFAWGETEPKSEYRRGNYRYFDSSENHITKYCNNPIYGKDGYTDSLTVLEPMDDVATIKWGSGARTPTMDEWYELMENTMGKVDTLNGVSGYRFIAPNGNSIFLPAAGAYMGGQFEDWEDFSPDWLKELTNANEFGYYWASTLHPSFPMGIIAFFCSPVGCYVQGYTGGRYMGFSVRPVRSVQ